MEGLNCTTSAPSGDGMLVLGHAENSQTSDPLVRESHSTIPFAFFQNLSAYLYYLHSKIEITLTYIIYIKYIKPGLPESVLKVVFKELSIHRGI